MHARRAYRPYLEQLEDRRLLAASLTANLAAGILTVDGTEAADRINLRQINGRISVDGINVNVGIYQQSSVAAGVVNRIKIYGLGGNDTISLNSETVSGQQALTMPASIYGGEGHDTIRGGWGHDWISGGGGADTIYGNKGNDILIGEAGSDLIYGDDGNDRIWGGLANDWLYGGAGNDDLFGEDGNDYLDGGIGLDITNGGAGFDSYRDDFDLTKPFYNGAAAADVIQQTSPTCATLAPLGELAQRGWNLSGQVASLGNGLYDIRLRKPSGFYNERVAFNGSWNDNDPARRNLPEFWTILLQRARLQLHGVNYRVELSRDQWNAANVASGYRLFDSGEGLYDFTGKAAEYVYANQANPQTLFNQWQSGKLIVLNTPGNGTNGTLDAASGIVAWHAYAVMRVYQANGQWLLDLYNPWAKDGNGTPRDGRNDGFLTITWSEFATHFKSARIA
jgi:hypothetical protein